jgi:hypothetical protein
MAFRPPAVRRTEISQKRSSLSDVWNWQSWKTHIAHGLPELWAKFRPLIGIHSQKLGQVAQFGPIL